MDRIVSKLDRILLYIELYGNMKMSKEYLKHRKDSMWKGREDPRGYRGLAS